MNDLFINQLGKEDYKLFSKVLNHALFLTPFLLNNTKALPTIKQRIGTPRNKVTIFKDIFNKNIFNLNETEFLKYLRFNKMVEYTLITLDELELKKDIEETTRHLSALADVMLNISYLYAYNNLIKKYGLPLDNNGRRIGFAVIALGKLGGFELNFSSDIDIMYVYDTELGKIYKKEDITNISIHEFFTKLSEKIQFYLSEKTSDGFVFRVDLRLRPYGIKGPLVLPIKSYETYYQTYGQTWEQLMLLKSRVAAGSINTGLSFIKSIKPFMLKKNIDYTLIEDLADIKAKIDAREYGKSKNNINIKLGRGGIREIEFIVQLLQILNYPKINDIYERNTLKALDKLKLHKLLNAESVDILIKSYKYLRKIEHMIQIENELQSHTIPTDKIQLEKLAQRCGYNSTSIFLSNINKTREQVHSIFSEILTTKNNKKKFFIDEEWDENDYKTLLLHYHIRNTSDCAHILFKIIQGDKKRPRNTREKRILEVLLEFILEKISNSEYSKEILSYFERFFRNPYNLFMLYDIVKKHPETLDKLTNIFSISNYVSELIITIASIDYLYAPMNPLYNRDDIYNLLYELTLKIKDEELEYEIVRKKHKELIFNVCYAFLSKDIDIINFMLSLSNLASGILLLAFNKAYNNVKQYFGDPLNEINMPCSYLLISLGKLGGYEMTLGSDLDLIFLYEYNGKTSGQKRITNQEFFTIVIQRTISYLSTTTTQGFLYKIDLRLRPSGSSGTLVTTINAFKNYHEKGGMLWEKQTLLKSRIINDNSTLSSQFNDIKERLLFKKSLNNNEIKEIYDMRQKIEREKTNKLHNYNIKSGYGGLIDIEFVVQLLQLENNLPQLHETNTYKLINILKEYKMLSERDYNILKKGYLFYRTIETLIRAYNNTYSSVIPMNKALLDKIALFYGYKKDGSKKIIDDYINIRKATRSCFNKIFRSFIIT